MPKSGTIYRLVFHTWYPWPQPGVAHTSESIGIPLEYETTPLPEPSMFNVFCAVAIVLAVLLVGWLLIKKNEPMPTDPPQD